MPISTRRTNRALFTAALACFGVAVPLSFSARSFADDAKKDEPKGLPLKPERKIEFTTTEGTWTSLDVSPDGKTIIFDMIGNLYTIPIEGGEAKRVTNEGMSFNQEPRFSPDGSHIVFLSDRDGAKNVWIAKADGSDAKKISNQVTETFATIVSPTWTPDGQYILTAYNTGKTNTSIWMFHAQGGSGIRITKGPSSDLGAVASRDGRYIYFARSSAGSWQLMRRDRTTGVEDPLTQDRGGAARPTLSPDDSLIVYASRRDSQTGLRVLDVNTGVERWLKYPVQRDEQESFALSDVYPGFAFTPDGRDIVVTYGGKIHRINVSSGDDRLIPYTVHIAVDLGPDLNYPIRVEDGPTVRARIAQAPVQSPDGKRVAFSSFTHLYVADIPGGTPKRLTNSTIGEFNPTWSPDGQWIAYVSWSANEGGDIWKIRADGGTPQKLTHVSAYYSTPAWSPDGSRIVALQDSRERFLEEPDGEVIADGKLYQLVWVSPDGGDLHVITRTQGAGWPHFSAEKDRVYIHSARGLQLFSVRFDGSDQRTELKIGTNNYGTQNMLLSPDGKFLLATYNRNLYLVGVPRVGGEPATFAIKEGGSSVPVKRLTQIGVDYFAWADGGKTITWALGSTFFRLQLSAISFEPEKKLEGASSDTSAAAAKKLPIEEIALNVEGPRKKPKGVLVLRGAAVITMKGDEIIPDADIVVTDNRITAIGKRGTLKIPADAKIMDVHGDTIIPGLIDTHDHHYIALGINDTQNWDFLAHLAYGVTTGRDPQSETNDIFTYQDLVDTGEVLGERSFSTGPGIVDADFSSAEETFDVIKKYSDYYRTNTIKSYLIGNRKQRQWAIEACKKLHIMPTTEGGSDTMLDFTHAIDGFSGNEHALPIVPLYEDATQLMAKSGIAYTPTFTVNYGGPQAEDYFQETNDVYNDPKVRRFFPPQWIDRKTAHRQWHRKDTYHFPLVAASAGKILREGGIVCTGGHGQFPGLATHWELWALQTGTTPHEALRAATLLGARALGLEQDLGSIETGKLADLVILTKDPLQDIHNSTAIRYVLKNGELFAADTMDQVWPQQKALPALWFWENASR